MEQRRYDRDAVQRMRTIMQRIRNCPANKDAMGLSVGEKGLLSCLSFRKYGVTAGELKQMTGIGASGVTNLMNALERKGLIRREMNPKDRRSVIVTISESGQMLIQPQQERILSFTQELLFRMGEKDTEELLRILEKMSMISEELYAERSEAEHD